MFFARQKAIGADNFNGFVTVGQIFDVLAVPIASGTCEEK